MTPDEYVGLTAERLKADGVDVTQAVLGGVSVVVGYRPKFRLAWMATRLHLFTVALGVETVSRDALEQFTQDALAYAVARKGRLRGFQTGVAVIPVLVGSTVEPAAAQYAEQELLKKWSAFAWPTTVDLATGTVFRHQGRVLVGGVYAKWMRSQTDLAVGA